MTSIRRDRAALSLVLWCLTLLGGVWLFTAIGDGALAAPPLEPSGWGPWAEGRDPLVATVAVLRLLALALSWYLVGVTTIGIVARLARAAALVRVADALTVPAVRRLLQGALGLSLATAVVTASLPAAGPTRSPRTAEAPASTVTLRVADTGGAGPGRTAVDRAVTPATAPAIAPGSTPTMTPVRDRSAAVDQVDGAPTLRRATPVPLEVASRGLEPGAHDAAAAATGADEAASGEASGAPARVDGGIALRDDARGVDDAVVLPDEARGVDDAVVLPDDAAGTHDEVAGADGGGRGRHVVRSGESLWSVAEATLQAAWGRAPEPAELERYWREVVEDNRSRLADPDNADLIFPGDELRLPAVPDPAAGT